MTKEQIIYSSVFLALFNDYNSDYRVRQIPPLEYKNLINYLLMHMPTQEEKDASQKGDETTPNPMENRFGDPQ